MGYKMKGSSFYGKKLSYKHCSPLKQTVDNLPSDPPVNTGTGNTGTISSADTSKGLNPVKESAKSYVKENVKKQAIKKTTSSTLGRLLGIGGTAMGIVAVGKMGYDAYKSGQEHSGGRVGYVKNPNYDPNKPGDKHGGADSNAQFIPKDGGEHKGSIWDKENQQDYKPPTTDKTTTKTTDKTTVGDATQKAIDKEKSRDKSFNFDKNKKTDDKKVEKKVVKKDDKKVEKKKEFNFNKNQKQKTDNKKAVVKKDDKKVNKNKKAVKTKKPAKKEFKFKNNNKKSGSDNKKKKSFDFKKSNKY